MTARPSKIRAYRIFSCLAVLHSAAVLGLAFRNPDNAWSWWWLGLATSLFLWPLVLAIHPGRSILRFLIPTIIAAALFLSCAPIYVSRIHHSVGQWRAASKLEKLLRSNPRMILYSVDADYRKPLEVRKGYRQIGADEIILPDDMFDNSDQFVQMDKAAGSVIASIVASIDQTVNSIADETVRSGYGRRWQILRKETNGSNEAAEAETEATPNPGPSELDREPYKGPAVLGYAEITDRAEQRTLITALASSARDSQGGMLCHNPRHGLYVETGTYTIDLSICFECQNVYLFGSDDKIGPLAGVVSFGITHAPESAFNATLKRHGIPISQGEPP